MKTLIFFLVASIALAQQCGKGGFISNQNQCFYPSYIEGCLNYASNNQCQECEYNYKLSNGKCYYSPSKGQDCCLSFDSQSRCTQCTGGLQPNPSTGVCQDVKIMGCLKKAIEGCEVCAKNYDLVNGRCIPSIVGCTQYDQNMHCVQCQANRMLNKGSCVPVYKVKAIPYCKIVTEYGCGQCQSGYRINSKGVCVPGAIGCLIHNSDGSCKQCQSPYYQLSQGKCAVVGCTSYQNGRCAACDSSVGFVLNNNRCEIQGCLYFTQNGCSNCANGLVSGSWGCRNPQGKVCLICKMDQFLGADGQCHKKNVHCAQYTNGVCITCYDSYFLDNNNQCQPHLPGCVYQNKVCSSCYSPFTFSNGECLIQGCLKYNKQGCVECDQRLKLFGNTCSLPHCQTIGINYQCERCLNGYELDQNGHCTKVDPNCLKVNKWNQCLKCKKGFRLDQNGFCSAQKWGCNYVDGRCTSCRAPFVYVPSTESCEIDGCLSYFVGGCKSCDTGYKMLYNTCKLPNCLISKNGKCLECDPDFIFKSDGTCVSKDEFCEKMDQFGTCIKCMYTYYYSTKLQKCVKKASGCKYNGSDMCIGCDAPFTYQGGKKGGRCVIKGCLRLNDLGCLECKFPFSLNKDKTCGIAHCSNYGQDGRCSACDTGYALSVEATCQLQDQYCQQYNTARSACLTCVKGYRVDSQGKCIYADSHCSSFDQTGMCINCDRLYFLNYYGKCQLRDPQCTVYTNGLCSLCRPFFFPKSGVCMANMAGCKRQKSYGNCLQCDSGYEKRGGICKAKITKLSWNSIDMNFFDDNNAIDKQSSQQVFTVGVDSKLNLVPVISGGNGKIFFSSSSLNGASYTLGSKGRNGWSPSGSISGQYIGYQVTSTQVFYAIDIQQLPGSTLQSFSIEYSMDGTNFMKVQDFSFSTSAINSITTFYFKAVEAKFIRLVVTSGTPNIRLQFYVSSSQIQASSGPSNDTFIGKTVISTVDGAEAGGISTCNNTGGLCWAGVESCQPRKIVSFTLMYKAGCVDRVTEVKIEYSNDGISFTCYDNCNQIPLTNDGFVFPTPLLAEKMRVHFVTYSGNPQFGLKFDYL